MIEEFRAILLSAPDLENYVSGVILPLGWHTQDVCGQKVGDYLRDRRVLLGVNVNSGLADFPRHPGEKYNIGLDFLTEEKLRLIAQDGVQFTKSHAIYRIGDAIPSQASINHNATYLAMSALKCQSVGLIPIITVDVIGDGTYPIQDCKEITKSLLAGIMDYLRMYSVNFTRLILMTNLVTPGRQSQIFLSPEDIAQYTIETLDECQLSSDLAGVALKSTSNSTHSIYEYFAALNKHTLAYKTTACFSDVFISQALKVFAESNGDVQTVQEAFLESIQRFAAARCGIDPQEYDALHPL